MPELQRKGKRVGLHSAVFPKVGLQTQVLPTACTGKSLANCESQVRCGEQFVTRRIWAITTRSSQPATCSRRVWQTTQLTAIIGTLSPCLQSPIPQLPPTIRNNPSPRFTNFLRPMGCLAKCIPTTNFAGDSF